MEDIARRSPRIEPQWISSQMGSASRRINPGKVENGALGTGAILLIRSRGSMRRQLKQESRNRNRPSECQTTSLDATGSGSGGGNNGGGGFGKWLRDHLGGGSRGNRDIVPPKPLKNRGNNASYDLCSTGNDKNLTRATYTPQNVYCSLPREHHRRHFHMDTTSKSSYERAQERARFLPSDGINFREWSGSTDISNIMRDPLDHGREVKSLRRRERERRRHSMNETREHSRHKRISLAKSKAGVNSEELIEIFEETGQKISSRKSSEENSDSDAEEDVIDEYRALRKGTGEKDYTSYRELSDLQEESAHNQEVAEIHRRWKYHEENVVDSSDDYGREEQEEELYSSESGPIGRLDEKAPDEIDAADESDENYFGLLDDTPAEILRDRGAIIEKLGELRNVLPELRRKNRLLQHWVARVLAKKHQTMTPESETLSPTASEQRYIKRLITCKTTIDEIEARQSHINDELNILENRLKNILEEDKEVFEDLLNREREIGVGLILEKSGRALNLKTVNAMIRRQLLRRELLSRDRFNFIFLGHRYEDLKMELRLAETLGEGMTIMDFDVIQLVNYSLRDKLEDREKELEKLYVKVQELVNALNNYKEKDHFHQAAIYNAKLRLEDIRADTENARKVCNTVRLELMRIRESFFRIKHRGGMLFAIPVVREMERTLKTLNDLSTKIERMEQQDRSYPKEDEREVRSDGTPATKLHVAGARTTVTRMTKVKRLESRNKPGRC